MIAIKSSAALTPTSYKVLLHGAPGTGKTFSIATAESPLLILTEKGGSDSLTPSNLERVFGVGTPGIAYDIPVAEAFTHDAFIEVMRFLTKSEEARKFKTIFLDSASQLSTISLKHYSAKEAHGAAAYGEMGREILSIFSAILDLPVDVVCTAHTKRVEEGTPDAKIVKNVPDFEGKMLIQELPHYFSEWYFADTDFAADGSTRYVVRTVRSPRGEAKSRFGHLAPVEYPNWRDIFGKLKAGNTKKASVKAA